MKLVVIVPAFNEEKTIGKLILGIPRKISGFDKIEVFSKNKKTAITRINTMKPNQVYSVLRKKMPLETQRYLKKVVDFKKGFVGI